MRLEVGSLSQQPDGALSGVLCTLTIRTQLELRPTDAGRTPHRGFDAFAGTGACVGSGEHTPEGITMILRSPELIRPLQLLAIATERPGEWRIFWTPHEGGSGGPC